MQQFIRIDEILDRIRKMKRNLAKAVSKLNLINQTSQAIKDPSSFVDFAIMIALYYLLLHVIERMISSKEKYDSKLEKFIRLDKWRKFYKHNTSDNFDLKTADTI